MDRLEARALLAAIPVYSTGVAANGQLAVPGSPEVHFQLLNSPSGPAQAYLQNPPVETYVANGPVSRWIGPSADPYAVMTGGDFVYRQTFDLTGLDPATAVLSLNLASDNNSRVYLNGTDTNVALIQTDDFDSSVFDALHPFTITTGFVPGINMLDVVVHNDYSATGLRLDLSGTADPVAPPVVTLASAIAGASSTNVAGRLAASEPGRTYVIDFYSGPSATPPATPGEPIGTVSVTADSAGLASFDAALGEVLPTGAYVFARATAAGDEPGTLSAGVPVQALADLRVNYIRLFPTPVPVAGEPYAVTFSLDNGGPSIATNVVMNTLVLDGASVIAAISTKGQVTYPSGGATLTIPEIASGGFATFVVWVRPSTAGMFRIIGTATADQGDPSPGDETVVFTETAIAPPVRPDLSTAFVASASAPVTNSDFTVTFRITNAGAATAADALLKVTIPRPLSVLGASGSIGVVALGDGFATLAIPTLGPGESASLTLTLRSAVAGEVTLSAVATSDSQDARPENDSSQAIVSVAVEPDPGPGPVVVSLRRAGVHRQLTQVVLSFDQLLEPGRAADLGNYQIILPGRDGRYQTADDQSIALTVAAYNADARTVTLIPGRRLSLRQTYQVVAKGDGPRGLVNLRGGALNSGTDGKAGPPYRVTVRGFGPLAVATSRLRWR